MCAVWLDKGGGQGFTKVSVNQGAWVEVPEPVQGKGGIFRDFGNLRVPRQLAIYEETQIVDLSCEENLEILNVQGSEKAHCMTTERNGLSFWYI